MGQRLADTAEALGIEKAGRELIARGYALAMEPRRARLSDDHDPAYLHPGRCAVILMDDLGVADPTLIAAGALVESESSELAVAVERMEGTMGPNVAELVAGVPIEADDELAERLLLADTPVRILALVERLDQLRHAHLWPDMDRRRAAHECAESVYLPVAVRTDGTLARRYRWWCSMFGRRYLGA